MLCMLPLSAPISLLLFQLRTSPALAAAATHDVLRDDVAEEQLQRKHRRYECGEMLLAMYDNHDRRRPGPDSAYARQFARGDGRNQHLRQMRVGQNRQVVAKLHVLQVDSQSAGILEDLPGERSESDFP